MSTKIKNKRYKNSTLKLVQTAALTAIIILMTFTPIGYLKIGVFSIALVTIPVVIGAMSVGPLAGLFLGIVFGATSFAQCFGMDAFGTAMFAASPVCCFLMCVPTRALMGYLTGVLFRIFRKSERKHIVSYFLTGFLGAFMNTLFFMSVMILCFFNTPYILAIREGISGDGVMAFLAAMVGINGIVEMVSCALVGGAIARILVMLIKRTSDGEYV